MNMNIEAPDLLRLYIKTFHKCFKVTLTKAKAKAL